MVLGAHFLCVSQSDLDMETFNYEHPITPLALLVSKTLEVQCPGCGEMKRMLVRHLKSDQKCAAHCSYLELESFDKQLKRFRHKRQCAESKQRKRVESESAPSPGTEFKRRKTEDKVLDVIGFGIGESQKSYIKDFNSGQVQRNWEIAVRDDRCQESSSSVQRISNGHTVHHPHHPFKLKQEGFREKPGDEVHIVKSWGELKKDQSSPASKYESKAEEASNNSFSQGSAYSSSTTTSPPAVPSELNPSQMVEAMKYLLETDNQFIHKLHEAYRKVLQRKALS